MSAMKSTKPRTKKQAKGRPWYITIINVARQKLDMDSDVYRSALMDITGKNSLKLMSTPELVRVLSFMQEKGFKIRPKRKAAVKKYSPETASKPEQLKSQVDKLRSIWIAMASQGHIRNGGDDALTAWAREASRRYNKGRSIDSLEWMNGYVADSLIEQLKSWHKRLLLKTVPDLFQEVVAQQFNLTDEEYAGVVHIQAKVINFIDSVGHNDLSPAYDTLFEIMQKYTGGAYELSR